MKFRVILLLLISLSGILASSNWAVSGLVTLDSVDPVLSITNPQENEVFLVGDQIPVEWSAQESNIPATCIDISWRADNLFPWQAIQTGYNNTGNYGWTAPIDSTRTANLRLELTDSFGNTGTAISDNFAILPSFADFSTNIPSGFMPLEVQFIDLSPGSPLAWAWDFNGDGITDSNEQNPVWIYDFPGSYTVSLSVDYGSETCSETRADYILAFLNPAITRYVPSPSYSTIQSAIDASNNGDYIIVADGIYFENLQIIDKEITLASHYFIDGDTLHIDETIIDGSQTRNRDEGSVIAIRPGVSSHLRPHIIGFTITHGRGRTITQNLGGLTVTKNVGGGIFIGNSNPILTMNKVVENDADDEGGGSYAFQSVPNLGGLVSVGRVNDGGNEFRDNHANIGKDIYIEGSGNRDEVQAQNCAFSVFCAQDTTVSDYWATSSAQIDYQGSRGNANAITADVYVATDGSDSNDGLTALTPFLTIDHALSMVYGSEVSPIIIHLAPGVYSPSNTGERYPLQMVSWVTLDGSGAYVTCLDAEASTGNPNRVFNLDKVEGAQIRDLTITGGNVTLEKGVNGGGIAVLNSKTVLSDITGQNFAAAGDGACLYVLNSELEGSGLDITGNIAQNNGGAVMLQNSKARLSNSSFCQNSAHLGGGIYANESRLKVDGCSILDNATTGSSRKGGAIYVSSTDSLYIAGSTLKGNSADNGAGIYVQNASGIKILGNKIVNNTQSLASFANGGGAMYWNNACSGVVANNLFANNTAFQGGAGYGLAALDFNNNTIANNRANYLGGAFYLNACSPSFQNNILWGNTAPSGGNQLYLQNNSSDPPLRYCDVQGGTAAFGLSTGSYTGAYENNLNLNPLFISPSAGVGVNYNALTANWNLGGSSPCINQGDPLTDYSLYPFDLESNPRVDGSFIDMGAYEYQFSAAPGIPGNVAISVENGQLILQWDSVPNTQAYRILASENSAGPFELDLSAQGIFGLEGGRCSWLTAQSQNIRRFYVVKASTHQ